jgi:hypothetical protein
MGYRGMSSRTRGCDASGAFGVGVASSPMPYPAGPAGRSHSPRPGVRLAARTWAPNGASLRYPRWSRGWRTDKSRRLVSIRPPNGPNSVGDDGS